MISTAAHPLAGAWDAKGREVSELLRARDHQYCARLYQFVFCRFCQPASLTLDLGKWTPANPLRLLLHGFIDIFPPVLCTPMQAGLTPMPPYVEAQLPDGSWKRVIDDMGFPAGLPRTIVVDLSGKLPPGTRRIRLVTNLQIYWDQALIDNGPEATQLMRQTELPLASAHPGVSRLPRTDRRQDSR